MRYQGYQTLRTERRPPRNEGVLVPLLVAFAVILTLRVPTVCAQSAQETALARSLFEEGVAAADAGRWPEAADRFGRAHSLKPTPGIAFNWASALVELGKLVEAGERLRAIAYDPNASEQLRLQSQEKLAQITPRVASLTVQVEEPNQGMSVTIDDHPLPRVAWGASAPVDPGEHRVTLLRGDETLSSEALTLAEGERRELLLVVPEGPKPAPVVAIGGNSGSQAPAEPPSDGKPLYKNWMLWTAVGVVVVGGVVTGLLLAKDDPNEPAPVSGDTDPAVIRW